MALIEPIDIASLNIFPDAFRFTGSFDDELGQLTDLDTDLATAEAIVTGFDISVGLGVLDSLVSTIDTAAGFSSRDNGSVELEAIDKASGAIGQALTAAQSAIGNSVNFGLSFGISIPPLTGITVTKPSAPGVPPPTLPPVGSSAGPGATDPHYHVSLKNLNQPGGGYYQRVGDNFQVLITGTPGVNIYVTANHDSKDHGQAGMGVIPANGSLVISGRWSTADIGEWTENWYAQGNYIGELSFGVR